MSQDTEEDGKGGKGDARTDGGVSRFSVIVRTNRKFGIMEFHSIHREFALLWNYDARSNSLKH